MNESQERNARVKQVIEQHLADAEAGGTWSDEAFIEIHSDLMPELQQALDAAKATRISGNVAAAQPTPDSNSDSSIDSALPEAAGYQLLREISRGGQAIVYEAVQQSTQRTVAIKVLLAGPQASHRDLSRFDREVQILATLDHPNIVQVIDRGKTEDGSDFLAMPFIRGLALNDWLADYFRLHPDGPPPNDPAELLRMFLLICDAVNVAHLRGIVHRDLKPSNIRVDERGQPHILDFGLARATLMFQADGSSDITLTGQFLGSLAWASPEQARGEPSLIDTRTDVYALGIVLFQMLTGSFPYQVVGAMRDVLNNIVSAVPIPPSAVLAASEATQAQESRTPRESPLNAVLDAIVLKALAKRRDDRYQNAGEFAQDVTAYLSGQQPIATTSPISEVEQSEEPTKVEQSGNPSNVPARPAPSMEESRSGKYDITGIQTATGMKAKIRVSANSPEAAIERAKSHGVEIAEGTAPVCLVAPSPSSNASSPSSPLPPPDPGSVASPQPLPSQSPPHQDSDFISGRQIALIVGGFAAMVIIVIAISIAVSSGDPTPDEFADDSSPSQLINSPGDEPLNDFNSKPAPLPVSKGPTQAELDAERRRAEQLRLAEIDRQKRAAAAREAQARAAALRAQRDATMAYWRSLKTQLDKLSSLPRDSAGEARAARQIYANIRAIPVLSVDSRAVAAGTEFSKALRYAAEVLEYTSSSQWLLDSAAAGANGDPLWAIREAKRLKTDVIQKVNRALDYGQTVRQELTQKFSVTFDELR